MEDKDKKLLSIKLRFSRAMRDLCNVMSDANREENVELVYSVGEDRMYIYEVDENKKRKVIDWYAAPINFYTEE